MANQAQFVKIAHLNHSVALVALWKRNQRNWVVQVDTFNKLSLIGHFSVFVKF